MPDFGRELSNLGSSLVVGQWDQATGAGGDNTRLSGIALREGHVIAVGVHTADANGVANGVNIPTTGVPSWARSSAESQSAVLARLTGTRMVVSEVSFYSGFEN